MREGAGGTDAAGSSLRRTRRGLGGKRDPVLAAAGLTAEAPAEGREIRLRRPPIPSTVR